MAHMHGENNNLMNKLKKAYASGFFLDQMKNTVQTTPLCQNTIWLWQRII